MNPLPNLTTFLNLLQSNIDKAASFILLLWIIHFVNIALGGALNIFGIIPRKPFSLIFGPLVSPFLHGDFNHLFYNSFPLFFMVAVLFSKGILSGVALMLACAFLEGIMVWLFARRGNHIGASGLIMALFGHFIYMGYSNPSADTIIVAVVLLYYFGTLLLSIFPEDMKTSFEAHLAGFIAGFIITHFGTPPLFLVIGKPLANSIILLANIF